MSDKTLRERLENTNNGAKPWPESSVKKVDYFVEWEIERGKFQTETLRNSKLQSQGEQLQAEIERYSIREGKLLRDNARLREAIQLMRCPPNLKGGSWLEIHERVDKALASTDSTWLAEHDKEVRRKVLNEAYKEVNCGITHVRWALEIIHRMADQPKKN